MGFAMAHYSMGFAMEHSKENWLNITKPLISSPGGKEEEKVQFCQKKNVENISLKPIAEGKQWGVSWQTPMVPRVCDSYGKTHGMAKAMGVSMAKPMGLNFSILTMVGSTMETADVSPTQNSEASFTIFVGSN